MKLAFFFLRFFSAFISSSLVSKAKATMRWSSILALPRAAAMSWVGTRRSSKSSFSRLIFLSATLAGRKSATAAQRMAASIFWLDVWLSLFVSLSPFTSLSLTPFPVNACTAAWYISSQLSTSMRWMPLLQVSDTGPAIRLTSAPRR